MDWFTQFLPSYSAAEEFLRDPHRVHAITSHLSMSAAAMGLVLTLLLTVSFARSNGLRWATFVVYIMGAVSVWVAMQSGRAAAGAQSPDDAARAVLALHARMGESAWVPLAAMAALTALSAIPGKWFRLIMILLLLSGSVVCTGYFAALGYHGHTLVHVHGLTLQSAAPPSAAPAPAPAPDEAARPVDETPDAPKPGPGDATPGDGEPDGRRPGFFGIPTD